MINDHTAGWEQCLAPLADPARRQLLDVMSERGQATATTLTEGLPISRQAVEAAERAAELAPG
ncbi:hypothetical protein AB0I66_35730 [Streptomyces sp. NPDC050439]|uniref:hypothetical protein n=1 Tax=unclassified Streptomyces TaxID=2593676 RepID=UPI003413185F